MWFRTNKLTIGGSIDRSSSFGVTSGDHCISVDSINNLFFTSAVRKANISTPDGLTLELYHVKGGSLVIIINTGSRKIAIIGRDYQDVDFNYQPDGWISRIHQYIGILPGPNKTFIGSREVTDYQYQVSVLNFSNDNGVLKAEFLDALSESYYAPAEDVQLEYNLAYSSDLDPIVEDVGRLSGSVSNAFVSR